jgi:hypothetical protein
MIYTTKRVDYSLIEMHEFRIVCHYKWKTLRKLLYLFFKFIEMLTCIPY